MKILKKIIDKDMAGSVQLVAQEPDDMWHAYNMIRVGDTVKASTRRNVQTQSDTGSVNSQRVRINIAIQVQRMDIDIRAASLRLLGTNTTLTEYCPLGSYHSLQLELNQPFVIIKKEWDSIALERLRDICHPATYSDVAAIVMDEGLAHVCLVRPYATVLMAKVELNIPRKRSGLNEHHDKGLHKFYAQVLKACEQHIDFSVVKCVLLASPGFVRDNYFEYMCANSKTLAAGRSKFVLVHSSSGFMSAIPEVMKDPKVASQMSKTVAVDEVLALEQFFKMLQTDSARAFYGPTHVQRAAEESGIQTLLISDSLFRSEVVAERKKYVALVEKVRKTGGTVRIFSSLHPSGTQLNQLTGVAAILRYPMEELDDEPMEDECINDSASAYGEQTNA